MISRTVAGVTLFTLFGVTLCIFLTLAATLYYDCPYQTPPFILVRIAIKYSKRNDAAVALSLQSLITSLPPNLRSGVRSVLESFGCVLTVVEELEHIPLAIIAEPPTRISEDILINRGVCKGDARCISWLLESATDPDVIFSTVRFTAGA